MTITQSILDPDTIQDPYDFYRRLLAEAPVWNLPDTSVWVVSRWDLVTEAVARPHDLSSHLEALLYTGDDGRPALFDMEALGANIRTLATADPPEHTAHRKVVFPELVEKRMTALGPTARTIAAELLDDALAGGRFEWMDTLANRLPVAVLAELLGFVDPDLEQLVGWSLDGAAMLAGTCTPERMAILADRAGQAAVYLAGQLRTVPPDPGAGVIGAVGAGVADGRLTEEEGISTLMILLGAGGESTGALVGNAVRLLAEHPDVQDTLRDDPSRIPAFIEEALRLESPFRGHYRMARNDTTLGDTTIPAGSLVYLLWAAANRDPTQFDAPDELRLDREHARGHLAFGRGIHFCVGAPLARMEARVAIELLLARTRRFTLDDERPPAYVSSMFVRRHEHLDLVIDPA